MQPLERPADRIEITFDPITYDGKSADRLVLVEPTVRAVRAAETRLQHGVNAETLQTYQMHLVHEVSGVALAVIDRLPISTLLRAADWLEAFVVEALPPVEAPLPTAHIIDLAEPIEVRGERYEQVVLREPTGAEMRQAKGHLRNGATAPQLREYEMALVQAVSGLPRQVVQMLPIRVFREAALFIEGFIEAGRGTGKS